MGYFKLTIRSFLYLAPCLGHSFTSGALGHCLQWSGPRFLERDGLVDLRVVGAMASAALECVAVLRERGSGNFLLCPYVLLNLVVRHHILVTANSYYTGLC